MEINIRGVAIQVDESDLWLLDVHPWTIATMGRGHRYVRACISNKAKNLSGVETIYLHRLICNLASGQKNVVDHIDGDTLNNCRSNLRITTQQKNSVNRVLKQGGAHKTSKGFYSARITIDGKQHYLGCFKSKEAAQKRYAEVAEVVHGEFRRK